MEDNEKHPERSKHEEFRLLMERVLAGSEEAAQKLVAEYGPALVKAIRRRLSRALRPKFDSQDFVQDVWTSFFRDLPRTTDFERPEMLAAFLAKLAQNKVADAGRLRVRGKKYNVRRERSLNTMTETDELPLFAHQATPSTVLMSKEEWQQLLQRQPLVYQHMLIMMREGKTLAEVAQNLRMSERQVRRIVERLLPGLAP